MAITLCGRAQAAIYLIGFEALASARRVGAMAEKCCAAPFPGGRAVLDGAARFAPITVTQGIKRAYPWCVILETTVDRLSPFGEPRVR